MLITLNMMMLIKIIEKFLERNNGNTNHRSRNCMTKKRERERWSSRKLEWHFI